MYYPHGARRRGGVEAWPLALFAPKDKRMLFNGSARVAYQSRISLTQFATKQIKVSYKILEVSDFRLWLFEFIFVYLPLYT